MSSGSYCPDWFLQPRRRPERAMVAVVAECYLLSVSTRRVEGLVRTLGIERLSRSPGRPRVPCAGIDSPPSRP
jgi:putative transposase